MALTGVALGISVALDDFGTGFTSIHYLQSYGFNHIKIDKTLVADLHADSKARLLIAGVILLAKGLDIRVTAEGVETEGQAKLLSVAGCQEFQGYLFGRPMPIADFRARFWRNDPSRLAQARKSAEAAILLRRGPNPSPYNICSTVDAMVLQFSPACWSDCQPGISQRPWIGNGHDWLTNFLFISP